MTTSETLRGLVPIDLPILQAPMAGVATPALAAAVSDAGGLGGLGLAASTPAAARTAIAETQGRTRKPFNVNFFCHELRSVMMAQHEDDASSSCAECPACRVELPASPGVASGLFSSARSRISYR